MLAELIDLAAEAGIEVRQLDRSADPAPLQSGVCRVEERVFVVLIGAEPLQDRIDALAGALREHASEWLESRFLPPAVRERIERAPPPR
ncbi:MAG: hypothetical protein J4G09_00110 [Proteobacteria bacterium]|nr:hypothetical protein [Pseudomonadota bacterium]